MAVGPLFAGLLLLAWLLLACAGWTAVTFLYRPNASFLALGAALATALIGGVLPALIGMRDVRGLLLGFALALLGSMLATWQTMSRVARRPQREDKDCCRR
jgi:hypothetical protein